MEARKLLRTAGLALLVAGASAALGIVFVRDQISRHRRDLFSARPLRRLAALGYLAGAEPSVSSVQLLRDYIAWEPKPMIRRRAIQLLTRMEKRLVSSAAPAGEAAG